MELEKIEIKNFRSFWSDEKEGSLDIGLCNGANFITGPNNCGKSNVLRAVALALQGDADGKCFNKDLDVPSRMRRSPFITLQFRLTNSGPEATLKKRAHEYELSVKGGKGRTFAEQNILRYNVQYRVSTDGPFSRIEGLQVAGKGAIRGEKEKLQPALEQFHKVVRFIYIKSGEDLSSALAGGLTEVLGNVLQDHLKTQMDEAEAQRKQYIRHLSEHLLKPLAEHLGHELGDVCQEIKQAIIIPAVPTLEETLSQAAIEILDGCKAPLAEKGTGVRGALMVALMDYLSRESKRSVIFALEEPESFLHPCAQEKLFDVLNRLAKRPDISLLVTTHSPFFLARKGEGQVTVLSKDSNGRTSVTDTLSNGDKRIPALAPLFADQVVPRLLDTAFIRADAKGVIVVEGYTDMRYLRMAAEKCGRHELINDLEIVYEQGAALAGHHAYMLKTIFEKEKPVFLLLDYDESGKEIHKKLISGTLKSNSFKTKKDIGHYGLWVEADNRDVEAEDLFPEQFMERFLSEVGQSALAERTKRPKGGWHIGLNDFGKKKFPDFINTEASIGDFALWIKALEDIRHMMQI